jgi:RNA polymerase sigma-70 factor (ECF subfamily)
MDEKQLVIQAKNGDVKSFCILYDNYKRKLYNYAYFKLGNSQDAEDVVQDCVLTAYEQLHKLKKPEAFSSWLFKILYFACISAIKTQIEKRNTFDIEDYENIISYDNNTDVERAELKQALDILSEDEKNIVLLSVVVGLNSKEIAKITGFTAVNVRQKLSRSLAKMKRYLS